MTDEEKWFATDNPKWMLEVLYGKASDRKYRLFGCACCRRVWSIYTAEKRAAVETAERFADGFATKDELRAVNLMGAANGPRAVLGIPSFAVALKAAEGAASDSAGHGHLNVFLEVYPRELSAAVPLLRDIFGNPFRPVALDRAWLTSDVLALARGIYDERAFDRMPILADALQDAGCTNEDVLSHCRDAQLTHLRGCWVVDLLTGRS